MQMKRVLSILTVALFAFSAFVIINADGSDATDPGSGLVYVDGQDIASMHPWGTCSH